MDEGRYRVLSRQLGRALGSELEKLGGSTSRIASAAWRPVSVAAQPPKRRLAIVAADAGNVTLRLNPLRIAFVRVASSDMEEPLAELIFQPDEPAPALAATICEELPRVVAPLRDAGLDPATLLESALVRRNRLSAVREILEWGAILSAASTAHREPVLVVRDGLLRSIHIDEPSFARLRTALLDACSRTGNQLVAVAKNLPGGQDLVNALILGGVMDHLPDTPLAFLEIPRSLEEELLPPAFVEGRRMGPLAIARVRSTGTFVPLEFGTDDADSVESIVASLFGPDAEFYPEPGQPVEVMVAHHRARISALDREWLRREFIDQLSHSRARLARLTVTAEVLGMGGPTLSEDLA